MTSDIASAPPTTSARTYDVGMALAGLIFAGAGTAFLLDRLDALELREGVMLPAVVLGLGLSLVLSSIQRHRGGQ